MELEEMKQIWCVQDEEPLYDFDVEALHRRIKSKKKRAVRKNNIYDFGLIAMFITVAILWSFSAANIYQYLFIAVQLINVCILWAGRVRRKKKEQTFDRTMRGDLDYAIHSVTYTIDRKKIMRWTYVLPSVILILLSMLQVDTSLWVWVAVAFVFVLAVLGSWWEYNHCYKSKKQELKILRDKLTEETEAEPV